MLINCAIIDDEPLARKGISNFVGQVPFLKLAGIFSNPLEALPVMNLGNIDLLFLDIHMPKMSGMEFLKTFNQPPLTVITSAYSDHALESFELNVIDYLIKPIPLERFIKAANKARDYLTTQLPSHSMGAEDYFFIKCKNKFEKIFFEELLFVEAMQNYVVIHTRNKRFVSYIKLKTVEEYLPSDLFLKVHKSFIVALQKIESIEGTEIRINTHTIRISRDNKETIMATILKNKFLHR